MLTSSHWALTEYQVLCSPYLETFLQGYKIGRNTFISQTRKVSPRAVKPSSKFIQLKYNGSGISVLFFRTVTLMFLCYSKGTKCSVEDIFWLEIPVNGCVTCQEITPVMLFSPQPYIYTDRPLGVTAMVSPTHFISNKLFTFWKVKQLVLPTALVQSRAKHVNISDRVWLKHQVTSHVLSQDCAERWKITVWHRLGAFQLFCRALSNYLSGQLGKAMLDFFSLGLFQSQDV